MHAVNWGQFIKDKKTPLRLCLCSATFLRAESPDSAARTRPSTESSRAPWRHPSLPPKTGTTTAAGARAQANLCCLVPGYSTAHKAPGGNASIPAFKRQRYLHTAALLWINSRLWLCSEPAACSQLKEYQLKLAQDEKWSLPCTCELGIYIHSQVICNCPI